MLALSAVVLASAMGAAAQSQSLGDYARAVRKEKRPLAKKVYTNDNLPTTASISVVGPPAASAEEKAAAKPQEEKEKQAQKESTTAEKQAPQDEQGWRDQISAQKKKISDLEHDLDLLQREYKLRIANYYADAGTQLRDQARWADEDAKYRADIAEKQKQVEAAKAQLQDLKEQARKAGMPDSISD
jgi:predicted RNase H-like nuclease (RuvC/YqgF family)